MLDSCVYLVYRAASVLITTLPLQVLFWCGEAAGLLAWLLAGKYRRLAHRNLAIALGREANASELRRLTRHHFQRLGANLLCTLKLARMSLEEVMACVALENENVLHEQLRAGRGAVVALSHLGSWELFAQICPHEFRYAPIGSIYQRLSNGLIDADVKGQRTRTGVHLFDRSAGFHGAIELLRRGGGLGILADQHAGDHGLWTPFFGRLASTTSLPALLAKRTGSAVLSAAIFTTGRARWRMEFTPRLDRPGDSVEAITSRINEVQGEQIKRAPEDWFWVHNRWKTPKPNFLLTRYKRGVYLPPEMSANDLQPFRILIRATNWLGDSVMSAAAVRAIKAGRPDAHITIAAPAKLAPVWQLFPGADAVLALPERSLGATVRLLRAQPAFDVAVLFPNSLRSALEVWLAGIPRRVGYRGHRRAWLLNQIVSPRTKPGPIEHQVHHYLRIVQDLGAGLEFTPSGQQPIPSPPAPQGRIKLGLCPGAEYGPAKRWLPERFAEVAHAVAARQPVEWHLFGTAADAATGQIIASQLGEKCVNRIGQTSLDDLITELRECRLLLTNDTGTMHLATLLGVPVVAIFGSTEPRLTGPLGDGHVVIRHHVECSPCFLRECPIDFRCMRAVGVEEVTAKVLALLAPAATTIPFAQLPTSA